MSLNVDLSRCQSPLSDSEKQYDAYSVGISLMALGIPTVGEKVADLHEILFRVRFYEKLFGPMLRTQDGTSFGTDKPDFWKRWSGVRVNVSKESRAQWLKRMTTSVSSDIEYQLRKEL